MSVALKIITLALVSVTLLGGCTKRKLSNKDKAKIKPQNQVTKPVAPPKPDVSFPPVEVGPTDVETPSTRTQTTPISADTSSSTNSADQSLTNSAPAVQPAPLATPAMPIVSPADDIAATAGSSSATTTKPAASIQPAKSEETPSPAKPANATVSTKPVETPKPVPTPAVDSADIDSCVISKTNALHASWNAAGNSPLKPAMMDTLKQMILTCAKLKQTPAGLDQKIADAVRKSFPNSESVVSVFLAIETSNLSTADKRKLYATVAGRSGVEIDAKGVQFFGPLEKAKTTATVVSYTINRYTGTVKNTVIKDGKTETSTVSLKNIPQTNERYVFDFSAPEDGYYPLHIGDGETKITVYFKFMKGSLDDLKSGKTATIILKLDSWQQVIEEEMRKLLADKAKELLEKGFDINKEPKNSILVRTCNLNANSIACTDPDYKASATVSLEEMLNITRVKR